MEVLQPRGIKQTHLTCSERVIQTFYIVFILTITINQGALTIERSARQNIAQKRCFVVPNISNVPNIAEKHCRQGL